jgi:hypothetical protein
MADKYRIKKHSNILIKQAKDIIDKIGNKIRDNNLSEASKVTREMLEGLKDMFTNIGKPVMKKRYAPVDGPPWSEDYNKTMEEINEDLWTAYNEMESLQDGVKTDFNFNSTQRENLKNRIKVLEERLEDFVLFTNIDNDLVHAKDTFKNLSKVDVRGTRLKSADVETETGLVTLEKSGSENLSSSCKVNIVRSDSNGFPGNLHQVKNIAYDGATRFKPIKRKEPEWKFYGEEDMHIVPEYMIDENPDTWFEYETCDIPVGKKRQQKFYGFDYKGGEQWSRDPVEPYKRSGNYQDTNKPNTEKPLRLSIELSLEEAQVINWINVNPYIPAFDGSAPPKIIDILVSDGAGYETSVLDSNHKNLTLSEELNETNQTYEKDEVTGNKNFAGQAVFTFPPTKAKVISIIIEQESPYNCRIGHIYYQRVDKIKIEESGAFGGLFGGDETSYETKRTYIEGPKVGLSQLYTEWDDNLGITDLGEDTFLEPITDILGGISGFLFGSTEKSLVSSKIESGIHGFEGWRWAIGVKGINVYAFEYAEQGELLSKTHIVGDKIKRVSLNVNEEIPDIFVNNENYDRRNDWIKYYISIDGNTWHRISPEGHDETIENDELVPEVYIINSEVSEENRNPNAGYIETETDPVNIKFKAILSRPTNIEQAEHFTPVLRGYALKMQTEGENV